jgi:hypothetical protein
MHDEHAKYSLQQPALTTKPVSERDSETQRCERQARGIREDRTTLAINHNLTNFDAEEIDESLFEGIVCIFLEKVYKTRTLFYVV